MLPRNHDSCVFTLCQKMDTIYVMILGPKGRKSDASLLARAHRAEQSSIKGMKIACD